MSLESSPSANDRAEALVERLFQASVGMFDVMSVHLGDRLGLYETLHEDGPATSDQLAARAAINARYAREWLEQQAATGILAVDRVDAPAAERLYRLPDAFAEPLLNRDSPLSIAPLGRSIVACAYAMPALIEAFRTGDGVDGAAYGRDATEAQGDFNRPWLLGRLGTELLPAIPLIHERLVADPPARVADIACGVGWASIAIALAYPKVQVDGFDLDSVSIELAGEHARQAGVGDRVRFAVRDASDPVAADAYDLAVIVEAVHDMVHPVEVLAAVRQLLRPGGSLLVFDEKTEESFTAPASELERMFYGFSIFACLPGAMGEPSTAATGTVIRASTMRDYAERAGFGGFERLDEPELEALRLYRLTP